MPLTTCSHDNDVAVIYDLLTDYRELFIENGRESVEESQQNEMKLNRFMSISGSSASSDHVCTFLLTLSLQNEVVQSFVMCDVIRPSSQLQPSLDAKPCPDYFGHANRFMRYF